MKTVSQEDEKRILTMIENKYEEIFLKYLLDSTHNEDCPLAGLLISEFE